MKKSIVIVLFLQLFLAALTYGQSWEWARGSTGTGIDSWPIAVDRAGNVFGAGIIFLSDSNAVFDSHTVLNSTPGGSAEYQCIITKYDSAGNFLWANGTENGGTWLMGIAADRSGNSYMFGTINTDSVQIGSVTLVNTAYPYIEYFLVKFDPLGNVLWAKNEGGGEGIWSHVGGTSFTYLFGTGAIATDDTGNVYITSNYNAPTVTIGPYTLTKAGFGISDDILVAKYDSLGNVIWATSSGGTGYDEAYGLTVTKSGDVYIAGVFTSSSITFGSSTIEDSSGGPGNAFIARYNAMGVPVWASTSGGEGNEFAVGLATDDANNVYLTGGVSDPEISFGGTSIINPHSPSSALYLVKFDTSNHVSWYKTIGDTLGGTSFGGASYSVQGYAIAISTCNKIWVCGSFGGPIGIDGHILDTVTGSYDPTFIACYNSSGVYQQSSALPSGADDQLGIACDASGNVYLCADYLAYNPIEGDTFIIPVVIGPDTLPNTEVGGGIYEWQYMAKYNLNLLAMDTIYKHLDTAICSGAAFLLHAPTGYINYLWDNASTGTTRNIDTTGIYWVRGDNGCGAAVVMDTFKVVLKNVDLSFSLGDDTTTCVPIILAALPGVSYLWQDGSTGVSYTASASGTYYVIVSKEGCKNTDSINVTIENIHAYFSSSPDPICEGGEVFFADSSTGIAPSYLWYFGDGSSAAAYNPSHTYLHAGIYSAYEIVSNYLPCPDTAYQTIYVDSQSGISLNITDTILCQGTYVTFTGVYSGANNTGIKWSMGNGDSAQDKNPLSYAYNAPGVYTVIATALYRVCLDTSASLSLTVLPGPAVSLGGDTSICKGSRVLYLADTVNANNAGASWLWNTGQTTPGIRVTAPGNYYVIVSIGGCQISDSILVKNDCYLDIPNVFTPNGDGVNDYFFPAQYLSSGMTSFHMTIYNRWGQLIFETNRTEGSGWDGKFNNAPQPAGVFVYAIDATFKDGQKEHHQGNVTLLR